MPDEPLKIDRNLLALAAFLTMTFGFFLAWPPLGLIVPSAFIFGALSWAYLRGPGDDKGE